MTPARSEAVEPFVRGAAWPAGGGVSYPRADPADARRLPADTWATAQIPVGVRLEFSGTASRVEIGYITETDELGYRGAGAGATFSAWRDGAQIDEQPAVLGTGTVTLAVGTAGGSVDAGPVVVYLPEGMKPAVTSLRALDGDIVPAPAQPRWIAYGDSITEGWIATSPARTWVAIAGREQGLEAVNLGYAGSARGELPSAEQIAALDADVISVAFGTNCWSMIAHTAEMLRAVTIAFLRNLRAGHEGVPIVVVSPIVRPDAEQAPNRLGATLADLRGAVEGATRSLADQHMTLLPGRDLLPAERLGDGIHPDDEGHRILAEAIGGAVSAHVSRTIAVSTTVSGKG